MSVFLIVVALFLIVLVARYVVFPQKKRDITATDEMTQLNEAKFNSDDNWEEDTGQISNQVIEITTADGVNIGIGTKEDK